ncbi:unnamed protein product [Boreogadus saida]
MPVEHGYHHVSFIRLVQASVQDFSRNEELIRREIVFVPTNSFHGSPGIGQGTWFDAIMSELFTTIDRPVQQPSTKWLPLSPPTAFRHCNRPTMMRLAPGGPDQRHRDMRRLYNKRKEERTMKGNDPPDYLTKLDVAVP